MIVPAPLPTANSDPKVVAARDIGATYSESLTALRGDTRLSDIAKAEAIDGIWRQLRAELNNLRQAWFDTRRSRLNELEQVVPIGPGIPDNASPADVAVMQQAFRTALEAAREASPEDRAQQYADAVRFGDDTLLRAVLTADADSGERQLIGMWTQADPDRAAVAAQAQGLRDLLGGFSTDALVAYQAFDRTGVNYPQPPESLDLPELTRLADQQSVITAGLDPAVARVLGARSYRL